MRVQRAFAVSVLLTCSVVACGGQQATEPDVEDSNEVIEIETVEVLSDDDAPIPLPDAPVPLIQQYDVRHYDIRVELDHETMGFSGVVTMYATPNVPGLECVTLHAHPDLDVPDAYRVIADDVLSPLEISREGEELTACGAGPYADHEELALRFTFAGTAQDREHYGLFFVQSDASDLPMWYTQFEAQGARRAFPCYDEPFDKATSTVSLIGDSRYTLLSNGALIGEEALPDGRTEAIWDNTDPISTYLITFVAGELETYEDVYVRGDGTEIPLTVYTELGHADDSHYAMHSLIESFRTFEELYGLPYPWESYGIVALPGFQYGGMENKGLTNIGADQVYWNEERPIGRRYGIFGVVAHELAHEWFGNLVTMQWWPDIWLNEGFASYMGDQAFDREFDALGNKLYEMVALRSWFFDLVTGPYAHPIVHDNYSHPEELFDGISYTMGQKVIEMLVTLMGRDTFFEALSAHLNRFALDNADSEDFFASMQEFTDIDLQPFVDSWLYNTGIPSVTASWEYVDGEVVVSLSQVAANGGEGVWLFPLTIEVDGTSAGTFTIDEPTEEIRIPADAAPHAVAFNSDGVALVELHVEGEGIEEWITRSQVSGDIARGDAFFRLIFALDDMTLTDDILAQVEPAFESILGDDNAVIRSFGFGLITDEDLLEETRRALCELALPWILESLDRPEPELEDIYGVGERQSAIYAAGYANPPGAFEAISAYARDGRIDYVSAALSSSIRVATMDGIALVQEVLEDYRDDRSMLRTMMGILAAAPHVHGLEVLREYMQDPEINDPQDSRMPRSILGALIYNNPDIAYSAEGMTFIEEMILANMDRPVVVSRTIRGFQDASERSYEERGRLVHMLRNVREIAEADPDLQVVVETIDRLLEALAI